MATKKPKRPTSLPIGVVPFEVTWTKAEMAKDSKDAYGETFYPACVLNINAELCKTEECIARTLLHEGAHAAMDVAGLDEVLTKVEKDLGFSLEEMICTSIENNLYPFIKELVKRGYFK